MFGCKRTHTVDNSYSIHVDCTSCHEEALKTLVVLLNVSTLGVFSADKQVMSPLYGRKLSSFTRWRYETLHVALCTILMAGSQLNPL